VNVVESELAFKKIMGLHQQGRSGLGLSKPLLIPPKGTHDYRSSYQKESDLAKAAQLHLQGSWIRWCDYVKMDLFYSSLLAMPSQLFSFCIQSAYNILLAQATFSAGNFLSTLCAHSASHRLPQCLTYWVVVRLLLTRQVYLPSW